MLGFGSCTFFGALLSDEMWGLNLMAVSIHHKHSIGPSIRPICTKCCLTKTDMIQLYGNFYSCRAFLINTRPDEILPTALVRLPALPPYTWARHVFPFALLDWVSALQVFYGGSRFTQAALDPLPTCCCKGRATLLLILKWSERGS